MKELETPKGCTLLGVRKLCSTLEPPKKKCVPLEEALNVSGVGMFTIYIMLVTGFVQFSGTCAIQGMSIIIPIAGCDLALTGFDKGLLTSASFTGMIFSSFLFGSLADQFGRRTVMLYCSAMNAVLAILASIAPTYLTILIIWLINGFLLGGVFSPAFFYVTEFSPQQIRARSVVLPTCLGILAQIYLPGLAWIILPIDLSLPVYGTLVFSSWRLFIALIAVPTVCSTFLLYKLPETPKYNLNKGNKEATLHTLRMMYAVNHKRCESEFPISDVCLDASDKIVLSTTLSDRSNFMFEMIRMLGEHFVKLLTPPLLFYTCLSCSMLFGIIGMYNSLQLWLPEQTRVLMEYYNNEPNYTATLCEVLSLSNETQDDGPNSECTLNYDIFIIAVLTALLQTIILVFISYFADKFGRKLLIVIFTSTSLVGCAALMYVNEFFLTVIIFCVTVVILASTFPLGVSIVVDFFPTSLRSSAVSLTLLFGRIGASGGSQIFGILYQKHCEELYWGIFGVIACTVILNILAPSKRIP